MNHIYPINQTKLYGLEKFINELIQLENSKNLPNKILLSGQKGLGKSTLAYHFINYVLSKEEEYPYDINNFEINNQNQSFKTILNKSNINFTLIDISHEKKFIDINQIRNLIINLKKSSFNNKPRFILIDNIESVVSIIDVPLVQSSDTPLVEMINDIPTILSKNTDKDKAKDEILSSPIYKNLIISENGRTTGLQINLTTNQDLVEINKIKTDFITSSPHK